MKKLMIVLALLSMATVVGANTFSSDGTVFEATYDYTYVGASADRALVVDGSFEAGCDVSWTCVTDNGCAWITDLVPLGLWNYDGNMVAWLGGFCGGLATCFTNICQDIDINGSDMSIFWMGYINDGINYHYFTLNGDTVFEYTADLADHLLDYQLWTWSAAGYGGMTTFCLNVDGVGCLDNAGDNLFLDWVEVFGDVTATEATSLSTVKALY